MKEPNKIDGNRRDLLKGLGIAAVVSLLPETGNAAQNNAAPKAAWDIPFTGEIPDTLPEGYNILLITCDQERYFERYPFPVPGRERLMKTGITFTNHQNTANVCTPSRSVMYTGLHMPHTRMFDNLGFPWMNYDLDPELRTVGHMMRELGYYTAYKGKWHLTREIDQPVAGKSVEEMDLGEIPTPRLHEIMEKYGFSDYHGIGDVIGKSKGGYFFDSVTTGQTISWLRNTGRPLNDENKPWFAAVNLVNPTMSCLSTPMSMVSRCSGKGQWIKKTTPCCQPNPRTTKSISKAGQTIRCLQTATSRSMSLADLPPIKSTRMPGR